MSERRSAKEIRDEIDEKKAKALGKKPSHHLTLITGTRSPSDYVVCTDGTEIAYSKSEEDILNAALRSEK